MSMPSSWDPGRDLPAGRGLEAPALAPDAAGVAAFGGLPLLAETAEPLELHRLLQPVEDELLLRPLLASVTVTLLPTGEFGAEWLRMSTLSLGPGNSSEFGSSPSGFIMYAGRTAPADAAALAAFAAAACAAAAASRVSLPVA